MPATPLCLSNIYQSNTYLSAALIVLIGVLERIQARLAVVIVLLLLPLPLPLSLMLSLRLIRFCSSASTNRA
jgi:hypothetical protein